MKLVRAQLSRQEIRSTFLEAALSRFHLIATGSPGNVELDCLTSCSLGYVETMLVRNVSKEPGGVHISKHYKFISLFNKDVLHFSKYKAYTMPNDDSLK